MTETPEIPEAALTAAGQALADEAGLGNECGFDARWRRRTAGFAITAALPHLNPEPTFTASEVKELTKKATEVALALGRREAFGEVAAAMEAGAALCPPGPTRDALEQTARNFRNLASQPHEVAPEPLTPPTGHSDLPPTPEAGRNRMPASCDCYKLPRATDGVLRHHPKCSHATLDLPEGRDQ